MKKSKVFEYKIYFAGIYLFMLVLFSLTSVLTGGTINLMLAGKRLGDSDILINAMQKLDVDDDYINKLYETVIAGDNIECISGINTGVLSNIAGNVLYNADEDNCKKNMPLLYCKVLPPEIYKKCMNIYNSMMADVRYFPVALDTKGGIGISYENSWGNDRNYGGNRRHEGTDIMADNNVRGYFPVVSMTDGVIEKKGWLKLGGYRLGIRSPSGAYYYYAHLAEYAEGIEEGMQIKAGTVIGTMGDTGYSETEGTTGNFPVHLHLGIYLDVDGKETSFNPYYILKAVERYRREFI